MIKTGKQIITGIIRKNTFQVAVIFKHQRKVIFGGKYTFSDLLTNKMEQLILAGVSDDQTSEAGGKV